MEKIVYAVPKVLKELNFGNLILESLTPLTQSGSDLMFKYKALIESSSVSCTMVNNFLAEARKVSYDNIVFEILENVSSYINDNKVSWALASACESINADNSRYNYMNRGASSQVSNLLEMNESDVISYIKAGALKNVMFCEAFRNIAKAVYRDRTVVESESGYTITYPVSMIEKYGDDEIYFTVENKLYKSTSSEIKEETDWTLLSNEFKIISSLISNKNITRIEENAIIVNISGIGSYMISERNLCEKTNEKTGEKSTFITETLRENSNLVLSTVLPQVRNRYSYLLEGVALIMENFDKIVDLDNVRIFTTKNDRFLVIENGTNKLYSSLLASNHSQVWNINENAVDVVSFIKSKTNVSLGNLYTSQITESVKEMSKEKSEEINESLHDETIGSFKKRIEVLTEKYKGNAVMMAVLSDLASRVNDAI